MTAMCFFSEPSKSSASKRITFLPEIHECSLIFHRFDSTRVDIYNMDAITSRTYLTRGGMILVALMSGNDYDPVCLSLLTAGVY
jgi:hypothetical protein